MEKQQRRLCTLVEQHNGLQYTLRLRESQLLEMENTMKSLERHSNPDPKKRHYDQARIAPVARDDDTDRI